MRDDYEIDEWECCYQIDTCLHDLREARKRGEGPKHIERNGKVTYRLGDVRAFLAEKQRQRDAQPRAFRGEIW